VETKIHFHPYSSRQNFVSHHCIFNEYVALIVPEFDSRTVVLEVVTETTFKIFNVM